MSLGPTQLLILLLIVVVLFGAKRLPEFGRGLGRSLREFRAGLGQGDSSDEPDPEELVEIEARRP